MPGVSSAALSNLVPLTGVQTPTVVAVAGRPLPPLSDRATAIRHLVSPRYFSTLAIPLRAGRDFDERDNTRVPHVVIINETFARTHFPGEDPIGRTLITGMVQRPAQVVGVVADIHGENLNTPPEPEYFLPILQRPESIANVLVRSSLPPTGVAPLVREALRTIDPDLPLLQPGALTARIAQLVGIAFGIAGALLVSRLMQQALFEVDPAEPLVYIVLSLTLLLVAEAASYVPARRATRIDPLIALRTG